MIKINDRLGIYDISDKLISKKIKTLTVHNNGIYWIQGPVLDEIEKIIGEEIELSNKAIELYNKINTIYVKKEKNKYIFEFNDYPSLPFIFRSKHKYNKWKSMVSYFGKNKYYTTYRFMAVSCIEWLKSFGYKIKLDNNIDLYTLPDNQETITFGSMNVVLREHQEDNLIKAHKRNYKILIADQSGLGKTISAGTILYKLNVERKAKRILWVVPNTQLVEQIKDEMKDKFDTDVLPITGDRYSYRERLGIDKNKNRVKKTIYEEHGFICTNWSLFSKDFGKDSELTKHIHFDAVVFDEIHRCKEGNLSYRASMEIVAPYRIGLTGTPMPNGKYEELYDILNLIDPPHSPHKKYFTDIYYQKFNQLIRNGKDEDEAKNEATLRVNKIALKYMMPRITIHSKENIGFKLPNISETKIHINLTKEDNIAFGIYLRILSSLIKELKSIWVSDDMSGMLKKRYNTLKATMMMIYQDLRRFCAFGSISIKSRINEYIHGQKGVYKMLRDYFMADINELKEISNHISFSPKNRKLIDFIDRSKSKGKMVIFCSEVLPIINLVYDIIKRGIDVKVIMGKSNKISKELAQMLNQSTSFKEKNVNDIIKWFWRPFSLISDFVRYANEKNNLLGFYFVSKDKRNEIKLHSYISLSTILPRNKTDKIYIKLGTTDGWDGIIADFVNAINEDGVYKAHLINTNLIEIGEYTEKMKVLLTTDKLQEGVNLQDASYIIFYDYPFSIREREQRMARIWRDGSYHKNINVIYLINGIEYKIEQKLKEKYRSSGELGFVDPKPISLKEFFRMLYQKNKKIDSYF